MLPDSRAHRGRLVRVDMQAVNGVEIAVGGARVGDEVLRVARLRNGAGQPAGVRGGTFARCWTDRRAPRTS